AHPPPTTRVGHGKRGRPRRPGGPPREALTTAPPLPSGRTKWLEAQAPKPRSVAIATHSRIRRLYMVYTPAMSEKLSQGQEKFGVDERHWRDVGAGLSGLDLFEGNGRRLHIGRLAA